MKLTIERGYWGGGGGVIRNFKYISFSHNNKKKILFSALILSFCGRQRNKIIAMEIKLFFKVPRFEK